MPLDHLLVYFYSVLTLMTLLAYGWDKLQAKREGRRVPERILHGLAWCGGFVGAWMGMRLFRHKTQKRMFSLVVALAALLHVGLLIWFFRA